MQITNLVKALWISIVRLPAKHDMWHFKTYAIAIPVFVLFTLFVVSKYFNTYPALEDAGIVTGVFFDDETWPTGRYRGRSYCIKTANGDLRYGKCLSVYGAHCPTQGKWHELSGKPARMWLVGEIAVKMEVNGLTIMPYEKQKNLYTKANAFEFILGPGILFFLIAHMLFRYLPIFWREGKQLAGLD